MKRTLKRIVFLLFFTIVMFVVTSCKQSIDFNVKFYVDNEIYAEVGTSGKEVIEIPSNPYKEGYIFEGWYWDEGIWLKPFTAQSLLEIPLNEDLNVYAYFLNDDAPKGTDIKVKDGVIIETEEVGITYLISVSNNIVLFSFNDYIEVSNKSIWSLSTDISGNKTISSKTVELSVGNNIFFIQVHNKETDKVKQYNIVVRRRPMYKVVYDTNGGSNCPIEIVEEDSILTQPESFKTGYTLAGWDYDFNNPVKSDLYIKAIWTPNKYNVTFDANGGVLSDYKMTISYDESYNLPIPVKNGYRFDGWYYYENKISNKGKWDLTYDINLVANWKEEEYSISYDLQEGKISSSRPSYYTYGKEEKIPNPSKAGYDFIGWTVNNSTEKYKDFMIEAGRFGDLKLVANYEPHTYKIEFNCDGGRCGITSLSVQYNSIVILPIPTKSGYEFDGWYYNDTEITEGKWKIVEDCTLIAKWEITQYKIEYDLNGGTNANNPTTYNYESNVIKLESPTKKGYTFIGWTGEGYNTPTVDIVIPRNSTNDKYYTAHWEESTYIVTFDVNGGDKLLSSVYKYTYNHTFNLPKPTRKYYIFKGWFYNGKKIIDGKWEITEDCTLIAKWEIINYSIQYNLSGGTNNTSNPYDYNYESPTVTFKDPIKDGYTFIGWTIDTQTFPKKDLELPHNSYNDIVITAHWKVNEYIITYDVNSGDELENNTQKVVYDSNYGLIIPKKTGYNFDGWYNENELIPLESIWKYSRDCTLKAHWKAKNYTITIIIDSEIKDYTVTYDSSYKLYTQYKNGYNFEGYYKEQDGKGDRITDKNGYSLAAYSFTENITIYPLYTYKIKFITNGGEDIEPVTYHDNECLDSKIIAKKNGKTFDGWYIDYNFSEKAYYNKPLENCTLYAKWKEEVLPSELKYSKHYDNNKEYIIIKGSTYSGTNLIIPSHIGGTKVTVISSSAFENMSNILVVEIPDSVESIGNGAFKGCNGVEKITLPFVGNKENAAGSTAVFGYIFGCTSKQTYVSVDQYKTSSGSQTTQYPEPTLKSYGYNYYYYIPQTIREVIITTQVNIPSNAFQNCDLIEKITIPKETESIGEYAFYNCSGLKYLNSEIEGIFNIPKSVIEILGYTFYSCSQVINFTMGEVKNIGNYAFYNCSMVENFNSKTQYKIEIPSMTESIGEYAFNGMTLIIEICVPDSVESIGNGAFKGCNGVEKITLPFVGNKENAAGSTAVFGYIFGCTSKQTYVSADQYKTSSGSQTTQYPEPTLKSYGYNYYYYIPQTIREVIITTQVNIPSNAFQNCDLIEKITIPKETESIGEYAFYNCKAVIEKKYDSIISSIWRGNVSSSYHSGLGTINDPYIIFTPDEFMYFAQQVNNGESYDNTYFKLTSNIRLNNQKINKIGSIDKPFNGCLNGNGYIIKDFVIEGNSNYTGLFGFVNGTIENLGFENVKITSTSSNSGKYYTGIIAYLGANGLLKNIYSTGTITNSQSYYSYAGGLVGYSLGIIESSYSTCNVIANSSVLHAYAGGLVGYLEGTIKFSFATGNVTAKGGNDIYSKNGGLVGDTSDKYIITESYRCNTQNLIKYNTTGSQYNEDGINDSYENIINALSKKWDSIWTIFGGEFILKKGNK